MNTFMAEQTLSKRRRVRLSVLIVFLMLVIIGASLGAQKAFAWLTAEHMISNDFDLAALDENKPIYAAVYGGKTLVFGAGDEIPDAYENATLTQGYTALDQKRFKRTTDIPWRFHANNITAVKVIDPISPPVLDFWFASLNHCTRYDLALLDTSRTTSMCSAFALSGINGDIKELTSWDVSACTDFSSMFSNGSITDISPLAPWDMSSAITLQGMFSSCSQLTQGDLSSWNVASVENMANLFSGCTSLCSVGDLSGWNVSRVKNFNRAFSNAYELRSIGDCSSWNTSNVETFVNTFESCYCLEGLSFIENWDMSSCTQISGIIRGNELVEHLDLTGWNTARFTLMTSSFAGCSHLHSIDVTGWVLPKLTSIQQLFDGCSRLREIKGMGSWQLGASFDTTWRAWSGCSSLERIDFSSWNIPDTIYDANALTGCSALTEIIIPSTFYASTLTLFPAPTSVVGSDGLWYMDGGGHGFDPRSATDKTRELYQTGTKVVRWTCLSESRAYAALYGSEEAGYILAFGRGEVPDAHGERLLSHTFVGMEGNTADFAQGALPWKPYVGALRAVVSENVDLPITTRTLRNFFADASNLETADLSALDTTTVSDMSHLFSGCTHIRSIDIHSFTTAQVTSMASAFKDCAVLVDINVSMLDTSAVSTMESMFAGCSSLSALDLASWDTGKVTSLQSVFSDCVSLEHLALPDTFVGTSCISIAMLFNNCSRLAHLDTRAWHTEHLSSCAYAFNGCIALGAIDGIEDWNTTQVTNMHQMFGMCSNLVADLRAWEVGAVTDSEGFSTGCPSVSSPFTEDTNTRESDLNMPSEQDACLASSTKTAQMKETGVTRSPETTETTDTTAPTAPADKAGDTAPTETVEKGGDIPTYPDAVDSEAQRASGAAPSKDACLDANLDACEELSSLEPGISIDVHELLNA